MTLWTWLVVIGVIADVWFVVHAYTEALNEWRRGIIRPPDRPSRRWFVLELFAVALVAVGVAGELFVDSKVGGIETQIRSANDHRVLLLQREAGDAEASASGAAASAQTAREHSDAANISASAASSAALKARREAEAIERESIDDLNMINESVQESALPREIKLSMTPDTPRFALFKSLREFAGTHAFIQREATDESGDEDLLAQGIKQLLVDAGWDARIEPPAPKTTLVPPGVWLITDGPYRMVERPPALPPDRSHSSAAAAALLPLLEMDLGPNDEHIFPGVRRAYDDLFELDRSLVVERYGFFVSNPDSPSVVIWIGPRPRLSVSRFAPRAVPARRGPGSEPGAK
jgi:hypothetical protein